MKNKHTDIRTEKLSFKTHLFLNQLEKGHRLCKSLLEETRHIYYRNNDCVASFVFPMIENER